MSARVPISPRRAAAAVLFLGGIILNTGAVQAMSLEQMQRLAGTALLEWRADKVFQRCGLPAAITDTAELSQPRQTVRWKAVEMRLSPLEWKLIYTAQRDSAVHENGWINPHPASRACLAGLSELVLHAKGEAGILTVTKRADHQGYRTSYDIPKDLYVAHQVIGLTGRWQQAVPISRIQAQYGKPDEVLAQAGGIKQYRYWVVVTQKQMPVSLHAVDFEVKATQPVCTRYTVQTSGFEFVQEKLDALLRQWEKDYVLD